jgi:unsaturated rhamnogalacturonyl hydrolase
MNATRGGKLMRVVIVAILVITANCPRALGQNRSLSQRMAATAMTLWSDAPESEWGKTAKWNYDQGVILKGIEGVWLSTGNGLYFNYIQRSMDRFVNDDGTIRTYNLEDFNIDNVLCGRNLLLLYKVTGREKYRKAAELLREQLRKQPRTSDGGFWHKKIYPYQMWLDGLYMGEPFYAEYAATFGEDAAFDDIAKQFMLMERHARDEKTGLLYHGWDESRKQRWANPETGRSPNFWGRAMGWYAMALVDTLEYFPEDHPQRVELVTILNRLASAVKTYQDRSSGLWYQVVDKGTEEGNYLEASASCMFVYSLAKGVRLGYLPPDYMKVAQAGNRGISSRFIELDANGQTNLKGTVVVGGLGGNPYRDGSYAYYLSEKVITNDAKGVGAFLLAANEMELAAKPQTGEGLTVLLDDYFNHEMKANAAGRMSSWHYKWTEWPNSGFSMWGNIFRSYGASTIQLSDAPRSANLRRANIYIIVDPDTPAETSNPNFISNEDIKAVVDWVRAGGVLVLMGNDVGNAELDHFNELAGRFGIEFKKDSRNRVQGNEYATGSIAVAANQQIFKTAKKLFLKEISTLKLTAPAKSVLVDNGDVIMAVSKLGKGTVFAVGDPWLYNEYVDGRRLPAEYDNFAAANDLSLWLIEQARTKR